MKNDFNSPQVLNINADHTFLFGNGLVQVMFDSEEVACGKFILQEGVEGSTDIHEKAMEIAYVIKGKVEYSIFGENFIVNSGQAIFIPPNFPHDVRNIGSGEASVFWIFAPNDHIHNY